MKINQLVEKVNFRFPSPYEPAFEVLVYKNPNKAEFDRLLSKTVYKEARGITNGSVVYVWDANLATHDDVLVYIENKVDIGKFIISNDFVLNADEVKTDGYFENHKMIKRMMGF